MTSTWYGSAASDNRLGKAQLRVGEVVRELNQEQRCVNCRGIFNPLEEIGRRSCSLHPMPINSDGVSASDYMEAEGTSRAFKNHYACCGATKTPENPLSWRDLQHEYYKGYEGCTRSDHIGSWGWTALLGLKQRKHHVAFERFEAESHGSMHAKHWLYVYPILFVQLIASLRRGASVLVEPNEAIRMVLGSNVIVFNRAEDVLQMNASARYREIKAGTRTLGFDACFAYIYMVENFGLPKELLTNEACRIIINQARQPQQTRQSYGFQGTTQRPTAEVNRDPLADVQFDPMVVDHEIVTPIGSTSALNKAMALIGMKKANTSSISSERSARASTKQSAFQVLHTQLFGKGANAARDGASAIRDDLYSTDADMILKESRTVTSSNAINVHSGRRFDLAQLYTHFIAPGFTQDADPVFFPFVVAPWIDITDAHRHFEAENNHTCHITHDMDLYSPYV